VTGRARRRSRARLLGDLEHASHRLARPWPTTVLWRWRYELGLAAAVWASGSWVGWWATGAAVAVVMMSCVAPPVRRMLTARFWCIVTPHRLRVGCAEARIHSGRGRLPAVLVTRRAAYGERLLLWCPAGTSIEDFHSARGLLRTACWAEDILIMPARRHSQLVLLEVVRPGRGAVPGWRRDGWRRWRGWFSGW
jgi:hypothetical protein